MKQIAISIDHEAAWQKLASGSGLFGRVQRWLLPVHHQMHVTRPMELIYLPTWAVTYPEIGIAILIDAFIGSSRIAAVKFLQIDPNADTTCLTPPIGRTQALEIAAAELLKARLARRSTRLTAQLGSPQTDLLGYPYWAYYFRRSTGMLDARLLDGATGDLAGPKLKPAFLAVLDQLRTRTDAHASHHLR